MGPSVRIRLLLMLSGLGVVGAHLLGRFGRTELANFLAIVLLAVPPILTAGQEPGEFVLAARWLVVPMLFGGLVMPPRRFVQIAMLLLSSMLIVSGGVHGAELGSTIGFLFTMAGLATGVSLAIAHFSCRLGEELDHRREIERGLEQRVADRTAEIEVLEREQKMRAVGRLTAGIAHDFNNLLTVVNSHCSLLLEDEITTTARADVESIHQAGLRAADLVQKMLGFGRRQILRSRPLDLGQTLAELTPDLRSNLPETCRLEVEVEPGLGAVLFDPRHFRLVLTSLVDNAGDAVAGRGTIVVRAVRSHGGDGEPGVTMTVEDDGCGVEPDVAERAFEPFFSTKDVGNSGLGLAMVHGIVLQSGGRVWLRRRSGGGTVIGLELPAARPAAGVK